RRRELLLQIVERAERLLDRLRERAARAAPRRRPQRLPIERVVEVLRGVVEDLLADLRVDLVDAPDQILDLEVRGLRSRDELVQLVDVRLVVLSVVEGQRLR